MSSEITVFNSSKHLRSFNDDELNTIIITQFSDWLCGLLSLTGENSSNRLISSIPALKKQCIGMGFDEIKKMFEMYADGKMSFEPRANYFDRILLGKIVSEYKRKNALKNSNKPKTENISPEEIKKINKITLDRVEKFFIKNRFIHQDDFFAYDILVKTKLISLSIQEKKSIKKDAIYILKNEFKTKKAKSKDEFKEIKKIIKCLDHGDHSLIKNKCKILALEDYYREKTNNKKPSNF